MEHLKKSKNAPANLAARGGTVTQFDDKIILSSQSKKVSPSVKEQPIHGYKILRSTLEELKNLSATHYRVACACIADGRWVLDHDGSGD